ncbi:MAG: hypothetical protein WC175_04240 [Candidatus Dojkabacteria bacterium]
MLLEDISDTDIRLMAEDFGFKPVLDGINKNEECIKIYISIFIIYKGDMHEFREYEYTINNYIYSTEYQRLNECDADSYKSIMIKYSRMIYRELFAQISNIKSIDDWVCFMSHEDSSESYLFKTYSFKKIRSYNKRLIYNHFEVDENDKWIIDLFNDKFLNNEY